MEPNPRFNVVAPLAGTDIVTTPSPTPSSDALPPPPPPSSSPMTPYVIGLFVLAVLYTLHIARGLLVPIAVSILLNFLFSPLIRWFNRRRINNGVAASIVALVVLGSVGATVMALSGPAAKWVEKAPESLSTVERRIRRVSRPLAKLQETTARVQDAASPAGNEQSVSVAQPSLLARATGGLAQLGGSILTVIFLTFFLLASGDLFMTRVIESIPLLSDKKKAVRIAREIEVGVSAYLLTVTVVNVTLGLVTWGVLAALGMPNAALWGAVASVLNFVPYVGAMLTVVVIAIAAIASFESTSHALLMPLAFFVINMLESNLFTPLALGRRFPLNSVALLVGLMAWWYLWGIPGAILAVPLMVTINICCDHIDVLKPYGAFLRR